MADKELKHLSKGDLIEIIYQMKKTEVELRTELEAAQNELKNKTFDPNTAGSLADVAAKVNGILEAAQRTADEYLSEIRVAKDKVDDMCLRREQETDRIISEKWSALQKKTEVYMRPCRAHVLLPGGDRAQHLIHTMW